MKFLLAHGAEINVKNQADGTPLAFAAANGRLATARFLLSQDVDVNVKDEIGRTALWWAGRGAHTGVIKLLRKAGATTGSGPITKPAQRYECEGISVLPPGGKKWTAAVGKKQVTFSKLTSARGQHTVIAFARSISLEPLGAETASMGIEEFLG